MKLTTNASEPSPLLFEAVERKGIGHPDTIADMIADEFNRLYLIYCMDHFDRPLNHSVDKTVVVGAASRSWLGGFEIIKPITVHIIGKFAESFEGERLPLEQLARQATDNLLPVVTRRAQIMDCCRFMLENGAGIQPDHSATFYRPLQTTQGNDPGRELVANDTVVAVGVAKQEDLGTSIRNLETYITRGFDDFPNHHSFFGTDVKIAAIAEHGRLSVTLCIPVHPESVSSVAQYLELIDFAKQRVSSFISQQSAFTRFSDVMLHFNTKDVGNRIYIAPFGTALGKGDSGAVGRGNRLCGYIDYVEPSSVEAPAGKNPLNHVGKIYQILAQHIAEYLLKSAGLEACRVTIFTQNGRPLTDPVSIRLDVVGAATQDNLEWMKATVTSIICDSHQLWLRLLRAPVLDRHTFGHCATIFAP